MVPDPIYKQIGALIKARRNKLHLKQENIASELRISRGSLANIETGRQRVLVHQLYMFASALQLKPSDLLPPPPAAHLGTEHTDLPIPSGLKAQQKKQIANLFSQVDTDQKLEIEGSHDNTNKR
jgi:transcriptional regulator with XRE-family HTH domain